MQQAEVRAWLGRDPTGYCFDNALLLWIINSNVLGMYIPHFATTSSVMSFTIIACIIRTARFRHPVESLFA